MTDTINEAEQSAKTKTENLVERIEHFFAELLHHAHADAHPALQDAKAAAINAVAPETPANTAA